ncbi:carbohydrate ABC transporter permease [Lentzea sp. HUAS12]|uniref:carbohydrate ABC transporter permease n=1 Tax=Lentzea sp. HUAS12 TaxID=2951806 RepID=UPI0020A097F1|nr:carbohydrate ABC transporter permease [Lentzea sp. HUAS12]USX56257.1 carbohydrate ABC transporter permease [Lentzea sp. HUAS12]
MTTSTTAPTPRARRASTDARKRGPRRLIVLLDRASLVVGALLFASPIVYMVLGSFQPSQDVLGGLSVFTPDNLTTANYAGLVDRFDGADTGYFFGFLGVSLLVTSVVVVCGLVVNSLAGYALARLRWRGKDLVLVLVLALVTLPFEAVAVPLFYMLSGMRDTVTVQALPFVASAFSIYLFHSFFSELPVEVEEAATLDGAGAWRTFVSVIVPMSKPVFASAAILTFLTQWGSFLWPVLVVSDPAVRPLPLAISVFQGQPPYDWGQIMAFGVVMVTPVLIVFLAFQRWFVQSLASSAVKG